MLFSIWPVSRTLCCAPARVSVTQCVLISIANCSGTGPDHGMVYPVYSVLVCIFKERQPDSENLLPSTPDSPRPGGKALEDGIG